jgi:hypothetical protein
VPAQGRAPEARKPWRSRLSNPLTASDLKRGLVQTPRLHHFRGVRTSQDLSGRNKRPDEAAFQRADLVRVFPTGDDRHQTESGLPLGQATPLRLGLVRTTRKWPIAISGALRRHSCAHQDVAPAEWCDRREPMSPEHADGAEPRRDRLWVGGGVSLDHTASKSADGLKGGSQSNRGNPRSAVAAIHEEAGNPPIWERVPGLPEVAVLSTGVDSRQFQSAPELAPADGLALAVNEDAMRRVPFDQPLVVPSVLCVTVTVR